jgi:hypothetical protein
MPYNTLYPSETQSAIEQQLGVNKARFEERGLVWQKLPIGPSVNLTSGQEQDSAWLDAAAAEEI